MGIKNEQIIICKKYNTEIYPVSDVSKIGVAENVKQTGLYPINGLRHRPKGDTNGWYIWAGENFSYDKNFFPALAYVPFANMATRNHPLFNTSARLPFFNWGKRL